MLETSFILHTIPVDPTGHERVQRRPPNTHTKRTFPAAQQDNTAYPKAKRKTGALNLFLPQRILGS